ncbi:hypothetical protein OG874_22095 [Nocardia sp. NBC_00565]|uniref:hypothetical protein n=1 Tax=Nocardia sp. NBC_00565 TaxID=2975993 RepID=UPI002E8034F3|nr:hypothetical protein [Nocardia sp. NBC_00565]WUC07609.1 hypothetical protein OG874_22095 [Nocardia sp. NBC_00565]
MLKSSDNDRLVRVGSGTPMGELMRRYWHPIAPAAELDANPLRTKEVRLLGQDLVLFRDRSGRLGLIDRYWAPLVWDEAVRDISIAELPCNWLQCQENSLDPVHTEWLHTDYPNYLHQVTDMGDETRFEGLGPPVGKRHLRIRFYDFEYGMAKARMVEGDTGTEEDWTRPINKPGPGVVSGIAGEYGWSSDTELIEQALATWDTIPEHARPARTTEAGPHVR